jgi:hypothetical protein
MYVEQWILFIALSSVSQYGKGAKLLNGAKQTEQHVHGKFGQEKMRQTKETKQ